MPSSGEMYQPCYRLQNQQTAANVPQVAVVEVNERVASALYRERVEQSLAQFGEGAAASDAVNIEVMCWM